MGNNIEIWRVIENALGLTWRDEEGNEIAPILVVCELLGGGTAGNPCVPHKRVQIGSDREKNGVF